jgi:hypothetical protein
MDRACSKDGKNEKCIKSLVRKAGRKRTFERQRLKWDDNIEMNIVETEHENVNQIQLGQDNVQ